MVKNSFPKKFDHSDMSRETADEAARYYFELANANTIPPELKKQAERELQFWAARLYSIDRSA